MDADLGKLKSDTRGLPVEETSRPVGSHDVALARPLGDRSLKEVSESNLSEYHLTARLTHTTLNPREISLILSVLEYQIVNFGCNFPMYLTLVELSMRLSNGKKAEELNDPNIRLSVLLAEILIKVLGKSDFSLDSKNFILVSPEVRNILSPYLMSKRTYGSRYTSWRPEKYIVVRAVPVSTLIERNSKTTKRYSAYTKGYGESHGNAHKVKTKPSAELDGDPRVPDKTERNLILRVTDEDHQKSNQLWIKFQNWLKGK